MTTRYLPETAEEAGVVQHRSLINRIVATSLDQRFLVSMLALLLLAAGIWSFRRLPVDAYPDISPTMVEIITQWPGHASEEVERMITVPVEVEMNGLPRLKVVRSISLYGLSDVTLTFGAHRVTGLLGPNGAGKTTLLRVAAGLRRPSTGSVRIDGADLHHTPARERARVVAFMEQESRTDVPLTVAQVVDLGRTPHRGRWPAPPDEHERQIVADAVARTDVTDLRGGRWQVEGDLGVLEARVEDGKLRSEAYPDPLQRVWSALTAPHSGDFVLSLADGFEAVDWGGTSHAGGGSHGALHAGDSLGPLLFVGCGPESADVREQWTLRDVAPAILEHFGL